MADIFISYKSENKQIAKHLAEVLIEKGWTVWWDNYLYGGEEFDEAIHRELTKSKIVIVIWSALSIKSRFVRDEARIALERNALIPVSYDQSKGPLGFGLTQVIFLSQNMFGNNNYQKLFDSIENKINNRGEEPKIGKKEKKKVFPEKLLIPVILIVVLIVVLIWLPAKKNHKGNTANIALKSKAGQVNQMIVFNRYDDVLLIINPVTKATLTREVFKAGVDTISFRYGAFVRSIDTIFVKDLPFDYYQIRNQYQNGININKIIFDNDQRVYGILVE